MRVFWYAPFDNAGEMVLAHQIGSHAGIDLIVQSCSHRFGAALPTDSSNFSLMRNLPPPVGEMGERRTALSRIWTAAKRSRQRGSAVRKSRPDLVHIHTFNLLTDWYGFRRLRGSCSRTILTVHDVRPHVRRLPVKIETALLRRAYHAVDHLVVAHGALADRLVAEFGVAADCVSVIPFPTRNADVPTYTPRPSSSSPLNLLFFGNLRPNKGLPILLAAMRQLEHDDRIQLVIAGRGESDQESIAIEASEGSSAIRAEIGHVTPQRRVELFSEAHIAVLPYTAFNSQSGILTEDCYGFETPAIVSDIGPLGETVNIDGTGWVAQPGDPQSLAEVIAHVADSPGEYRDAVLRIKKIALTREPRLIAGELFKLYEEVLTSAPSTSRARP